MTTLFQKIKKALGFYTRYPYYYKIEDTTGEPVKVSYAPTASIAEPIPEESIISQEAAIDTKDDGIDLSPMTKPELFKYGRARGIAVSMQMRKQEIIDKINAHH